MELTLLEEKLIIYKTRYAHGQWQLDQGEKPKAEKKYKKSQERGLNFSMANKGLTEKMGLCIKPKGSAGTNYVAIWRQRSRQRK